MITPRRRQLIIFGALALTLVLVIFAPEPSTDHDVMTSPKKAESQIDIPSSPVTDPAKGVRAVRERVALDLEPGQLFRVPPPPPPPVAAAPEAPKAPPLPFAYMGRLIGDRGVTVFLTLNGQPISAKAGDTINSDYRIDSIEDTGIDFTYMPLKQKQRLTVDLAR